MARKRRRKNQVSLGSIIGIAVTVFLAGGATAWFILKRSAPEPVAEVTASPSPVPSATAEPVTPTTTEKPPEPSPVAEETGQVYWLKITSTGTELAPLSLSVRKSDRKEKELETLFATLLAGSKDSEHSTNIPAGTKLIAIESDKDDIKINLSREFSENNDSPIGRLAQVLYTATSLNPKAKVWISVEGSPLTMIGEGDGLEVMQPLTRESFEANYQLQ